MSNFPSNAVKRLILEKAANAGSFTIPSISAMTGLSSTSVARYVEDMKEEGMIVELAPEEKSGRGRRAITYGLRNNSRYFVGVDIKNFGLSMGAMNFSGEMVHKKTDTSYEYANTHENMDEVCNAVLKFIRDDCGLPKESIACVAFCLGGRVNSIKGTSASLYNFEETHDTPLANMLGERLGLATIIENDTKTMAYGEYARCKDKWQNMLFVNMGWGLGLGIILGGELYNGSDGYSGELGHVYAYDNNVLCHCGKKGCIETEVSGRAVVRKITARIMDGEASTLSKKVRAKEPLTTYDILNAIDMEDPLAIDIVSRTGTELGKHLAGMMNIFNPECIVIGGKFAELPSWYFIQQAALAIKQYSLKLISQHVPIIASQLQDDAGIMGACLLARSRGFAVEL